MLQQTQVPRVREKYKEFLKEFPNAETLANSELSEILKIWSGMGYNRRAKFLRDAAKQIVEKHNGKVPRNLAALRALPGVGEYTAKAVRVFAFNEPEVLIETNIRAATIKSFFRTSEQVRDSDLVPVLEKTAKGQDPSGWNWALMDYGAHLKKVHENPTRRSVHYSMQSKFEGSVREVRGAILKMLTDGTHGDLALSQKLHFDGVRIRKALSGLATDGLIIGEKGSWRIA
jgi:A/G-specific adenine glycosylase